MVAVPPHDWVCALRIEYADGSHEDRVFHRGTEAECHRVGQLVPAREVPLKDKRGVLPKDAPPLEEVSIPVPVGRVALHATVIVCRAHQLDT